MPISTRIRPDYRPRGRPRTKICIEVDTDLLAQLDAYAREQETSRIVSLERALAEWLAVQTTRPAREEHDK